MSSCLLILNYNGRKHLDDCLTSALEAAGALGSPCPVALVDNQSTEDDIPYVRARFPGVQVIVAPKNDFLFSLNAVIEGRSEDVVFILNNDMRFDRGFLEPLLFHFKDPDVFAATARVFNWDGSAVTTGRRAGHFRNFWFYKEWDLSVQRPCYTLDAGGGCAAFRRLMFVELGGFDPLFRPAYCEDTDLSYRAWKRGWKVIYEPRSVIYHKIAVTLDAVYGRPRMTRLIRRNEVLLTLKNCLGWGFAALYLSLLPWRALKSFVTGNGPLACGIFQALPRVPAALWGRWKNRRAASVKDELFLRQIRCQELSSGEACP